MSRGAKYYGVENLTISDIKARETGIRKMLRDSLIDFLWGKIDLIEFSGSRLVDVENAVSDLRQDLSIRLSKSRK